MSPTFDAIAIGAAGWDTSVVLVPPDPNDVREGIVINGVTGTLRVPSPIAGEAAISDSPASILSAYLIETLGLFKDPANSPSDWPLFISSLPDGTNLPNNVASIYDRTGDTDGRIMSSVKTIVHYGIQIVLRVVNYSDGWTMGTAILEAFETVNQEFQDVSGKTYIIENITRTTQLTPTGVESGSKRRDLFSLNFITTIKEN